MDWALLISLAPATQEVFAPTKRTYALGVHLYTAQQEQPRAPKKPFKSDVGALDAQAQA